MTIVDMARFALAILWGGALCGFGFLVVIVATHDGGEGPAAIGVLLFAAAMRPAGATTSTDADTLVASARIETSRRWRTIP